MAFCLAVVVADDADDVVIVAAARPSLPSLFLLETACHTPLDFDLVDTIQGPKIDIRGPKIRAPRIQKTVLKICQIDQR